MQDLNDKITGGSLLATEWNEVPSELQNVIEGLGLVLSGGDLNQLGKAIAGYVANGTFYTDSGAANAYVLSVVGAKQAPAAYTDGFKASFRADNSNTGATTVNVAGLGAVAVFSKGAALVGGELVAGEFVEVVYDAANTRFDLSPTSAPAVAGYNSITKTYVIDASAANAPVPFDVDTIVTPLTSKTVGPTASGADYIWAELDALPAGTSAILVNVFLRATSTAAGAVTSILSAIGGDNVASSSALVQTTHISGRTAAAGESVSSMFPSVLIPVNSANVFAVYYVPEGGVNDGCILYLKGWGE